MKTNTLMADPEIIQKWATRNKCWMCKHRFDKAVILPVDKPVKNKFQPKYNMDVLFHLYDTHGIPHDILIEWINGSIYGQELTLMGIKK